MIAQRDHFSFRKFFEDGKMDDLRYPAKSDDTDFYFFHARRE